MTHAAQLTTHAAPSARVTPPLAHAADHSDGGVWLFMVAAPISFILVLGAIIYLSAISF